MILIGVKSKYGSCNGNCTGLIIFKNLSHKYYVIPYIVFLAIEKIIFLLFFTLSLVVK